MSRYPLSFEQQALLAEGRKVMLPIERWTMLRVLSRHLRRGTRYTRAIPTDGIASVTLSLSSAQWLMRGCLAILIAGFRFYLPGQQTPAKVVCTAVVLQGVVMVCVGLFRGASAARSRTQFRSRWAAAPAAPWFTPGR